MSDKLSKITRQDVVHVARLSRLSLLESEVDTMADELNAIVQSMEALRTIDTTGVQPTAHAMTAAPRLRPDCEVPSLTPEQALDQAPRKSGSAFVVPKVVG